MLTIKMQSAINAQINAEIWSAYLYLSMSMDAQIKQMPGLANWFYVQWLEELDHARILQKYLIAQDARVELKPIAAVPTVWDDPIEMMRETCMHEEEVTGMISDLMLLALDEKDFATQSRLQWFVDEQVEEESTARGLLGTIQLVIGDSYGTYELDHQLGRRRYNIAEPLL